MRPQQHARRGPWARRPSSSTSAQRFVYCFDHDIPAGRYLAAQNQARDLAALLGVAGMGVGPTGSRWRVSDPAHDAFGHEIPPAVAGVPDQFASRDEVGLAVIDEVWVAVELVADDDEANWRRRKTTGPGRDRRLLPDQRVVLNGVQRPFMQFRDAVAASRPTSLLGWPLEGTSASNESQQALLSVGLEWMTHSLDFIQTSGLSRDSGMARLHKYISEALVQSQSYDFIDIPNSAGCEYLARALLGAETATRKNPVVPDYAGLDSLLVSALDQYGGLRTTAYTKYVAGVQRDEAQVLKQSRLWNEEQQHLYKVSSAPAGESAGGSRASPSPASGSNADKARGRGRGGRDGGRGRGSAPAAA